MSCSLCCFIINTFEPMGCGICMEWPALPSSYANHHWHFLYTARPFCPTCNGPENHQTLATMKSIKWSNKPPWDVTIVQSQLSICRSVDVISQGRFCCFLKGLTVRYSVCERLPHSSSTHSSLLSTFLQSSIHPSIHSSFQPSVHVAFVPQFDPSVMAPALPCALFIYI